MPSIKSIEVRLHVADISRSAEFYVTTLGFEVGTLWPDDSPRFAILSRDGVRLQLACNEGVAGPAQRSSCTLWLDVAEIGELYSSIREKVSVEWGPEVFFYGRREFAFKDPDGHLICLSEFTDDPTTCTET